MKLSWNRYVDRFHALSQRERLLTLLAVLATILLLGYMAVIEPQLSRQKMARQMLAQQQTDLTSVRAQLAGAQARAQDPDADNRASLQRARQQAIALDQRLKAIERNLMPPDKVAGLLDAFLQRDRRLQLVSLRNLPAVD
ncbi:MAG: type II secretion system protein M, partial [Burkholderiales bacterium]|nr:type II secretion system protein M [Burkholderiales bacterium]